ncbi:MAG: LysM peptidoglycan-binding domain-containing protein [Hyphomicrobiales bacterium]|nr:LysM peptidoglycan-binding domain-containing protein [Hyphomicrobiales bacterium]
MVTKPGEASRILTKPEAADSKVAKQATEVAEVAAADEAEEKLAAEEKAEEAATTEIAAEKQSSDTDTKVAAAAESEPAKEMAEEKTETKVAVTDQASGTTSGETVKTEPEPAAEAKPEMAKEEPETVKSEPETVKSPEETAESEAVVAAEPTLRIDAVEIENGRVFIAGSATPGGAVRVYADGQAVGSSDVSDSGRFLVEAQKDIAVGDHTISADLVMQADAAPVMRVAVPFTRPEGEMVAAVAAPATDSSATSDTAAVETGKKSEKPAAETSATNETAAEKTEVAAADTKSESTAASEQTSAKAEEKSSQMAAAETPEKKGTGAKEGSANEAAASASDTQTQVASADTQSDDTNTVVQPALEPRDGSVIIRRGDTLWQISRRVYGRGVRYTTIYLANEDQIKNPDMIEPGQIFMVPDEPLENAEELHRDRIRGR